MLSCRKVLLLVLDSCKAVRIEVMARRWSTQCMWTRTGGMWRKAIHRPLPEGRPYAINRHEAAPFPFFPVSRSSRSVINKHLCFSRVYEEDVEKKGAGLVLRSDPTVQVSSRAHKMSKSRGNVVNPDDVVTMYGADSLRLYEMFMGPIRDTKVRFLLHHAHAAWIHRLIVSARYAMCSPGSAVHQVWSTKSVEGVHRFLARAFRLVTGDKLTDTPPSRDQLRLLHATIKRVCCSMARSTLLYLLLARGTKPALRLACACLQVTEETEGLRFNTAIAAMMEFVNGAYKWELVPRDAVQPFVLLLAPYAPHLAEELWQVAVSFQSAYHVTLPWDLPCLSMPQ